MHDLYTFLLVHVRACRCEFWGEGVLKSLSGRGRTERVRERRKAREGGRERDGESEEWGRVSCRGLELRKGAEERRWAAEDAGEADVQPECGCERRAVRGSSG